MVEAIKNLGEGTKKAGACGVLRVVISYPTDLDGDILDNALKGNSHPLATVAVDRLESPDSTLSQHILGLASLAVGMPDRKRKSSQAIDGTRGKRQRIE
jgi:hypothetical protein